MDENNLPQSFSDYVEPSAIPFRFGAPGWYVLFILIFLMIAGIFFLAVRSYLRNRYRKQAIQYLSQLQAASPGESFHQHLMYETAILLKRVAMAKFGRTQVAGLSGNAWIQWLNSQVRKSGFNPFDEADRELLVKGIYQNNELDTASVSSFIEKAKYWIRHHHAI